MRRPLLTSSLPVLAIGMAGLASNARADILYSTIQGSTASSSVQPAYSSSLNLTGNVNNAGPYGFGDDYTTAYNGLTGAAIKTTDSSTAASYLVDSDKYVQVSSISFYGDVEPGPNGSVTTLRNGDKLYSLGADLNIVFYDLSGARDLAAGGLHTPAATDNGTNNPATPSAQQGPGFHTYSFGPLYIPASGYVVLEPGLPSDNAGNGSTPIGTTPPTFIGYFGNAPTVGTGTAGTFATVTSDPNNPNNGGGVLHSNSTFSNLANPTPANPDSAGDAYTYTSSPNGTASSGYLQLELDGTGLGGTVPEPASLGILGLAVYGLMTGRQRRVSRARVVFRMQRVDSGQDEDCSPHRRLGRSVMQPAQIS